MVTSIFSFFIMLSALSESLRSFAPMVNLLSADVLNLKKSKSYPLKKGSKYSKLQTVVNR